MSAQPEALRLADALEQRNYPTEHSPECKAAAELRRLHAENDALRAALAEHQESLTFETAAEAKADREHAEAYYRQAEHLLTSNEKTLHAEIARLKAQLAEQPAEQEPVAWIMPEHLRHQGKPFTRWVQDGSTKPPIYAGWTPLYTAPQPAKRVPLTVDEAKAIAYVGPVYAPDGVVTRPPQEYRKELEQHRLDAIRRTEAAHGIKGETK